MARVSWPLRVIGVLDPRWAPAYLSAAETDATEADPRPGRASTSDDLAALDVSISGAQAEDLVVTVLQTGYPELGREDLEVGYRLASEAGQDQIRGHQAPVLLTDALTADFAGIVRAVAWCDVTGHVAIHGSPAVPWSSPFLSALDPVSGVRPAYTGPDDELVRDVDGLALAYLPGTTRLYAVGVDVVARSDDHGETWVEVDARTTLAELWPGATLPTGVQRARLLVDAAGALLWLAADYTAFAEVIVGAYSTDGGGTWTEGTSLGDHGTAGTWLSDSVEARWDACAHPDGYLLVVTADTDGIHVRRVSSAADPVEDAAAVQVAAISDADSVSIVAEPSGVVWVYVGVNGGTTRAYYSLDGAATWARSEDVWPSGLTIVPAPHPHGGVWGGAYASDDTGPTSGGPGGGIRLGGWTAPGISGLAWAETTSPRADYVWWGADPDGGYWSAASLVGSAVAWVVGTARPAAGAASSIRATVYSGDRSQASARWAWSDVATSTTGADTRTTGGVGVELRARNATAPATRRIAVYADEAGYRVRDEEAAAWLTAKIAADMTEKVHFRLSFNGDDGEVLHRSETGTAWTRTTFTGITATGSAAAGDARVEWGHLAGVAGTSSRWYYVAARGIDAPSQLGVDNRSIGASRYPVPEAYDVARERLSWLRLRGGPGLRGEEYSIPAGHGYPHEAISPIWHPSPSAPWASTATDANATIAVDLGADDHLGRADGTVVFAVRGANVRRVKLRGKPDGGAWGVVATLDLAEGFADLVADRSGRVLTAAAASSDGARYLRRNELAGGFVVLDEGGPDECVRRVVGNSAGWWSATSGGPRARVQIEADGTEPVADTLCTLVWPAGVLVVHDATPYRYWSVRVDAGELCPEDGWRLKAYLCGAVPLGKQWGGAAEWTHTPNVAGEADPYGTEWISRRGPTRRTLSVSWDEGQIERRFVGVAPEDAPYLSTTLGRLAVAQDDVRGQLAGLLEDAEGGALPVVVLLGDYSVLAGTTVTDPTQWVAGLLRGELRAQSDARYDPTEGESLRVGAVLVVESV